MTGPIPPFVRGVPRVYRYDWALFEDWCTATNVDPVPAAPVTVARFLHDNPAAPRTLIRRITAINTVHRNLGCPAPGASPQIRVLLDARRRERRARYRQHVAPVIADLPTAGWPAGVFGRRDAALLMFVGVGYDYRAVARLRRRDVTVDGDVLVVNDVRHCGDGEWGVPDAYRRWTRVLALADRHIDLRLLAAGLPDLDSADEENAVPAGQVTLGGGDHPLFVPIDRWGHLPLGPAGLSPAAIASIVDAHLTGTATPHTSPVPRVSDRERVREPRQGGIGFTAVNYTAGDLDPQMYQRGLDARKHGSIALASVGAVLDEVEDRAEVLLRRMLAILEENN